MSCEVPTAPKPPGFHTTVLEPKRVHLRAPTFENTTKIEKTPRERQKERIWERERENKRRNFGPPHPSGPHHDTHQTHKWIGQNWFWPKLAGPKPKWPKMDCQSRSHSGDFSKIVKPHPSRCSLTLQGPPFEAPPSRSKNSTSKNWPKSKLAEVEIGRSRNWPKSKLAEVELAELEKKKLAEVEIGRSS